MTVVEREVDTSLVAAEHGNALRIEQRGLRRDGLGGRQFRSREQQRAPTQVVARECGRRGVALDVGRRAVSPCRTMCRVSVVESLERAEQRGIFRAREAELTVLGDSPLTQGDR